ncbi:MAG TPA: hypothetical protein VMX57_06920, partial [Planctomycetota bacterium]|nr:hypothetical protein [Planctomycetota bacterium]
MSEDERLETSEQPDATGAPAPERPDDEGLTPEERTMLESLSPGAAGVAPAAEETPEKPAEGADLALSPENEAMLAELAGGTP